MPPAPAFLQDPTAVLAPVAIDPARPPAELPHVVLRPRPLPAEAPLARLRPETPPQDTELPTKPLVRLPRVDLETPVELPPLARFQPERAPLTDVTGDASRDAVLAAPAPVRATPEAFVRFFLPDPFEFRATRLPPRDPMP
jgi:hypothetical protein